jgi:hypothetical protein
VSSEIGIIAPVADSTGTEAKAIGVNAALKGLIFFLSFCVLHDEGSDGAFHPYGGK